MAKPDFLWSRRRENDATEEAADDATGDLFRARMDQIINMKHELAELAAKVDWEWLDAVIAPLFSAKGRPGIPREFDRAVALLKQVFTAIR